MSVTVSCKYPPPIFGGKQQTLLPFISRQTNIVHFLCISVILLQHNIVVLLLMELPGQRGPLGTQRERLDNTFIFIPFSSRTFS